MPSRTASKLSEALAELEAVRRKLQDTKRALELAEAKMQEKDAITQELMLATGVKETCSGCGAAVFWIRVRGYRNAQLYNPNGTMHWPRCPKTARPGIETLAVGE
jgi:hypothetical protein